MEASKNRIKENPANRDCVKDILAQTVAALVKEAGWPRDKSRLACALQCLRPFFEVSKLRIPDSVQKGLSMAQESNKAKQPSQTVHQLLCKASQSSASAASDSSQTADGDRTQQKNQANDSQETQIASPHMIAEVVPNWAAAQMAVANPHKAAQEGNVADMLASDSATDLDRLLLTGTLTDSELTDAQLPSVCAESLTSIPLELNGDGTAASECEGNGSVANTGANAAACPSPLASYSYSYYSDEEVDPVLGKTEANKPPPSVLPPAPVCHATKEGTLQAAVQPEPVLPPIVPAAEWGARRAAGQMNASSGLSSPVVLPPWRCDKSKGLQATHASLDGATLTKTCGNGTHVEDAASSTKRNLAAQTAHEVSSLEQSPKTKRVCLNVVGHEQWDPIAALAASAMQHHLGPWHAGAPTTPVLRSVPCDTDSRRSSAAEQKSSNGANFGACWHKNLQELSNCLGRDEQQSWWGASTVSSGGLASLLQGGPSPTPPRNNTAAYMWTDGTSASGSEMPGLYSPHGSPQPPETSAPLPCASDGPAHVKLQQTGAEKLSRNPKTGLPIPVLTHFQAMGAPALAPAECPVDPSADTKLSARHLPDHSLPTADDILRCFANYPLGAPVWSVQGKAQYSASSNGKVSGCYVTLKSGGSINFYEAEGKVVVNHGNVMKRREIIRKISGWTTARP